MREQLEERTNRQLRKTLVFRGIPEADGEKNWQHTENLVASKIAETLGVTSDETINMIDRCHRGGNPKYYQNKNRPIYAAMHSWKQCEDIIWTARKKKNILVDYKYGPMTSKRRFLALKKRRELIDSGTIVKGHVSYPARLMGKGPNDNRYKLIEDFSQVDVY